MSSYEVIYPSTNKKRIISDYKKFRKIYGKLFLISFAVLTLLFQCSVRKKNAMVTHYMSVKMATSLSPISSNGYISIYFHLPFFPFSLKHLHWCWFSFQLYVRPTNDLALLRSKLDDGRYQVHSPVVLVDLTIWSFT